MKLRLLNNRQQSLRHMHIKKHTFSIVGLVLISEKKVRFERIMVHWFNGPCTCPTVLLSLSYEWMIIKFKLSHSIGTGLLDIFNFFWFFW